MEGRVRKYMQPRQQLSPERAREWKEKPEPKQKPKPTSRKVAVVYYLCKNRQLEHPHFIEVGLVSSEGLFLRDVVEKLNVVRGSCMASMYSWSCKRRYKDGFVWHDLCDDDIILPVNGNEYVLKGSELVEESNSGRFAPSVKLQNLKQLPEPPSARSQDDSSSSTSMSERDTKTSQDDELSPPVRHSGSSDVSPKSNSRKSTASNGSEYKIHKTDASTQTEENSKTNKARETCTRGISTDDVASSSTDTLESLIIADASKYYSFKRLQESQKMQVNSKLRATDMLMQLISCGSISAKDHSFGLIPSYKPRLSDSKFPSPLFSTSVMLRELDCHSDKSSFTSIRLQDKEYASEGLVEAKLLKKEDTATLKRSSSYNADSTKNDSNVSEKDETATLTKCIPKSLKPSLGKHSKNEPCPSNWGSKTCCSKKQSGRLESFREEKENAIKVEERLASGARVIINS